MSQKTLTLVVPPTFLQCLWSRMSSTNKFLYNRPFHLEIIRLTWKLLFIPSPIHRPPLPLYIPSHHDSDMGRRKSGSMNFDSSNICTIFLCRNSIEFPTAVNVTAILLSKFRGNFDSCVTTIWTPVGLLEIVFHRCLEDLVQLMFKPKSTIIQQATFIFFHQSL